MEKIESKELIKRFKRVVGLLEDAHPGLMTWLGGFHDAMDDAKTACEAWFEAGVKMPNPPDQYAEKAHAAVRATCEHWRRSLLVDGPTDHLHSAECVQVAELLREAVEKLEDLRAALGERQSAPALKEKS